MSSEGRFKMSWKLAIWSRFRKGLDFGNIVWIDEVRGRLSWPSWPLVLLFLLFAEGFDFLVE